MYFFVNSARNSGVNAWRTRATSPIKISETGYLSCYRNLPRSVRDTFLRCEMHTFRPSSTSIRRRGERACVCACRLTEIVPSLTPPPPYILSSFRPSSSFGSSPRISFVSRHDIVFLSTRQPREHCHDLGLTREARSIREREILIS